MTSHVTLSSERQDWQTPEWFLDLVREVAPIAFDPCSTPDNPTRAARFIAQRFDGTACGLMAKWPNDGLAFVNPPYGAHLSGPVDPFYEHRKDGELSGIGRGWANKIAASAEEALVLCPVRTETKWWRTLYDWSFTACLWSSRKHGVRINFVDAATGLEVKGSNLASCVFYRGPQLARFREVFAPHGLLVP